eukprot:1769458-Amphidinium_carterae.1
MVLNSCGKLPISNSTRDASSFSGRTWQENSTSKGDMGRRMEQMKNSPSAKVATRKTSFCTRLYRTSICTTIVNANIKTTYTIMTNVEN